MPLEAVFHYDVRSVIIPYIFFYYIKVKFADEGDNTVNDPGVYYAGGDNRLSPSLQPPTTGNVLIICVFFIPVRNCILLPEIILLSSTKQNIQAINILE